MAKVLYLSHAGEDVYDLIREAAGTEFEPGTRIADCWSMVLSAPDPSSGPN